MRFSIQKEKWNLVFLYSAVCIIFDYNCSCVTWLRLSWNNNTYISFTYMSGSFNLHSKDKRLCGLHLCCLNQFKGSAVPLFYIPLKTFLFCITQDIPISKADCTLSVFLLIECKYLKLVCILQFLARMQQVPSAASYIVFNKGFK